MPIHIYGTPRRGKSGPLSFLPPSNLPFLEEEAKRNILGLNAARLFNLDVPALQAPSA